MSKLQELVEGAYSVCTPCGKKYGAIPDQKLPSTFHHGWCDIHDGEAYVTEFSAFGYERKLLPKEQFTKEHLEKL